MEGEFKEGVAAKRLARTQVAQNHNPDYSQKEGRESSSTESAMIQKDSTQSDAKESEPTVEATAQLLGLARRS